MKLSKNSFNVKLFESTYSKNEILPTYECEFFWKSLFAWILMIPCWPGHLWNLAFKKFRIKGIWWAFHSPILAVLGSVSHDILKTNNSYVFYSYVLGWATAITIVFFAIIGVLFAMFLLKFTSIFKSKKSKRKWIIPELFKGIKDKYCHKIEWID